MTRAFLALGSNLQNPIQQVSTAIDEVSHLTETKMINKSSLYLSRPVGVVNQPDFINAVIEIDTTLRPEMLLTKLLAIEDKHHRIRKYKNGPRTLDIDILLYGKEIYNEDSLTIPHPRMTERAFVLIPLLEIAPLLILPCGNPISYWLHALGDVQQLLSKIDRWEIG